MKFSMFLQWLQVIAHSRLHMLSLRTLSPLKTTLTPMAILSLSQSRLVVITQSIHPQNPSVTLILKSAFSRISIISLNKLKKCSIKWVSKHGCALSLPQVVSLAFFHKLSHGPQQRTEMPKLLWISCRSQRGGLRLLAGFSSQRLSYILLTLSSLQFSNQIIILSWMKKASISIGGLKKKNTSTTPWSFIHLSLLAAKYSALLCSTQPTKNRSSMPSTSTSLASILDKTASDLILDLS